MPTIYISIKEPGKVDNRAELAKAIKSLQVGLWEVKFSKKNKRSLSQNAYFHGPVCEYVLQGLRDMGWNEFKDTEQVKSFLKAKFLKVSVANPDSGEVLEYIKETHKLSKIEFMEFIDDIAQFCSEYLNFPLPMPNQQTEIFQ